LILFINEKTSETKIKLFDPLSELTSLIVSKQIVQPEVSKYPPSSSTPPVLKRVRLSGVTPLILGVMFIGDDIRKSLIVPLTLPIMFSLTTDPVNISSMFKLFFQLFGLFITFKISVHSSIYFTINIPINIAVNSANNKTINISLIKMF